MKIKEILYDGEKILKENNIEDSRLKSRMLLSNILKKPRGYFVIHDTEIVDALDEKKFFRNIEKLKNGTPIQYIIGKTEFYGLEFFVNKNVLIPQPDTEILVEEVLNLVQAKENLNVLDLCTGSGAIAISLKKHLPTTNFFASDISEEALKVAIRNSKKNKTEIKFVKSDLFENINRKFNIIVSNPPYIERATLEDLPEEVKKEPKLALDGGEDGLDFYRIIAKEARYHLEPKGILALEIGYNQKNDVIKILEKQKYKNIYAIKDYGGNDRVIIAEVKEKKNNVFFRGSKRRIKQSK